VKVARLLNSMSLKQGLVVSHATTKQCGHDILLMVCSNCVSTYLLWFKSH